MPKSDRIATHHAQPCGECGHRNLHGISGCTCVTETSPKARWCSCAAYQAPGRDRVADQAAGVALGRQGADAALHGHTMTYEGDDWRKDADARMAELIATGKEFTAEDVTDKVGMPPEPNAVGGLFSAHRKSLVTVRHTTATRKAAHGRTIRVVRGRTS